MAKVNTHRLYNTVDHDHLDSLVSWATGDYPASGLLLVTCANGQYFLEIEFGDEFDSIPGISNPYKDPYVPPTFYDDLLSVREAAISAIKKVYTDLKTVDLHAFFSQGG